MGFNKFAMVMALAKAVMSGSTDGYVPTAPYIVDYFYKDNPGSASTIEIECNAIKTGDLIVVMANGWDNSQFTMSVEDSENHTWMDGVPYTEQQYINVYNPTYSDSMPFHLWTRVATKNYTSLFIRSLGASYSTMVVLIVRNVGTGIFDDGGARGTALSSYVYGNIPVIEDNPDTTYPKDLVIAGFSWYNSGIIGELDSNWPMWLGRNDGNPNTNKLIVSVKTTDTVGNYDPVCRLGMDNASYLGVVSIVVKGKDALPAPTITTNTPSLTASNNTVVNTIDALWASGTISQYIIVNNKITTTASATPSPLYYGENQSFTNQRITLVRAGNANTEGFVIYVNSQGTSGNAGYEAFVTNTAFSVKKNGVAFGNNYNKDYTAIPVAVDYTQDTTYVFEKIDGVVSLFVNGVKCYRQLDLAPINSGTVGFLLNNNNASIKSVVIERWNPAVADSGG